MAKVLKEVQYIKANGGFRPASEAIVRETALTINVNGQTYTTAMLLATQEKEFVIGHLFGQGIINSPDDIRSLTIKNNVAEVNLAEIRKITTLKTIQRVFKIEAVFACVRTILKSDIFSATEAVHSAGLFLDGKEPVAIAEDIGRHNALDKVIGSGLLQNIDFRRMLAASTGRLPLEMIARCRRAGIPVIASKGVPTTLAVAAAEKAGITVAGLVRGDTMIVYSHPARIESENEKPD